MKKNLVSSRAFTVHIKLCVLPFYAPPKNLGRAYSRRFVCPSVCPPVPVSRSVCPVFVSASSQKLLIGIQRNLIWSAEMQDVYNFGLHEFPTWLFLHIYMREVLVIASSQKLLIGIWGNLMWSVTMKCRCARHAISGSMNFLLSYGPLIISTYTM